MGLVINSEYQLLPSSPVGDIKISSPFASRSTRTISFTVQKRTQLDIRQGLLQP